MIRSIFVRSITLLLFCLPLYADKLNKDNDAQVWVKSSFKKSLGCYFATDFTSEFRFGGNLSSLYFYYFQGRLLYTPTPGIEIAPGFRQHYFRPRDEGKWLPNSIPMGDITFYGCLQGFEINDRNRFQFPLKEQFSIRWVYRNRLTLFFPQRNRSMLRPMMSNEIFFKDGKEFVENRYETGWLLTLGSSAKGGVTYIVRTQKRLDNKWYNTHNFRIRADFSF